MRPGRPLGGKGDIDTYYVIDKVTGCWNWIRKHDRTGYGQAWREGRWQPAHRVLYEREHGSIPVGFELDHLCRNKGCVNPEHVEPVTHAENMRRGRMPPHTKITPEQAEEIRRRRGTNRELAKEFGVATSLISRIRNGLVHLPPQWKGTT